MKQPYQIPNVPESERTPTVNVLLDFIQQLLRKIELLEQANQLLKDEIAVLKSQKPKPPMLPGKLEKKTAISCDENGDKKKRPGSEKRHKTATLEIHKEVYVAAESVPQGSIRKGYNEWVVQEIAIQNCNTRYLLERWQTPDGKYLVAKLPQEINNQHFGPELIRYILYQYYHCHVTRPLIREQLTELGLDISSGEIDAILIQGHDTFHAEKDEILRVGLRCSKEIRTDDTGGRHDGKNCFCTQIGSDLFTWFKTTDNKSRVNFLQLLRCNATDYFINEGALWYIEQHGGSDTILRRLRLELGRSFCDKNAWDAFLANECNLGTQQRRIATEATLFGCLLEYGISKDLVVQSDDAKQFDVFVHGLCWVHAERPFRKMIPLDDKMRRRIDEIRDLIWRFYQELKEYKQAPTPQTKELLNQKFDEIFSQETEYLAINQVLKSIKKNKQELLLVLERPYVSLHNNGSEREIREYVKRRKISGGTRSDLGRQCRDTFTSLKKTCRKLGISFWCYLLDRITNAQKMLSLPEIILQKATAPPVP